MNIEEYKLAQKFKKELDSLFGDIVCKLEEDRYYPSVREAGTAPTEAAIDGGYESLLKFFSKWMKQSKELSDEWLNEVTFEDLLEIVTCDNVEDFDELEEIDSFVNDTGERKYRYDNIVYKHKPSGRFLIVETQNDPKLEWPGNHVQTYEGNKVEKVSYVWE